MGTKNNPGKFDCYANAAPDEPMFVLLGRDASASIMVRFWAAIQKSLGEDKSKVDEALQCAQQLEDWALGLGKQDKLIAARVVAGTIVRAYRE